MTPGKSQAKKGGIRLTDRRKSAVVEVSVDLGALGTGTFGVRPLLYTDDFVRKVSEAMVDLGTENEALTSLMFPLIASWDLWSTVEEIQKVIPEFEVMEDAERQEEDDEDDEGNPIKLVLYRVPLDVRCMALFPSLGNVSFTRALMRAMNSIPLESTVTLRK